MYIVEWITDVQGSALFYSHTLILPLSVRRTGTLTWPFEPQVWFSIIKKVVASCNLPYVYLVNCVISQVEAIDFFTINKKDSLQLSWILIPNTF